MTDQPCVGEHSNQYFGDRPIFRIKGNRLAAPAGLFMHLIQAGMAQSRSAYNSTIAPPLPRNRKSGHAPGFLCPPTTHSMSAIRPKADIKLNLVKRSANDPKRTLLCQGVFPVIEFTISFISSISISFDSVLLL